MVVSQISVVSCDGWTCIAYVAEGTEEYMQEKFKLYTAKEIQDYNEIAKINLDVK
jgi:hypothetical protein